MIKTIKTNHELKMQVLHVILSLVLIIIAKLVEAHASFSFLLWGLAFIVGGYYKAVEGIEKTIENRALNVEILMLVAALAAFMTRDFQEGAILIFIFALSGVLETYANTKSERALTSLLELAPSKAIKLVNNEEIEVEIDELKIDDVVIVKVGQQIPVDGIIIKGSTSIDEAAITGEFIPAYKSEADLVYAGTLNIDATILVKITKNASESTMQKIVDFVKEAQMSQTKSQNFVERFEKVYVYAVILMALLVMVVPVLFKWMTFDQSFYKGVIVLVVGSPCAVVASITPAILSSLSYGANRGILIKGGAHFDKIRFVDTAIFDKTGTITSGKPQVVDFVISEDQNQVDLIKLVVNIERASNHPLANAIASRYQDVETMDLITNEVSGSGMECEFEGQKVQVGRFDYETYDEAVKDMHDQLQYESVVEVVVDGKLLGFISLKDTIRDDAALVIEALNQANIKTILLSGDRQSSVEAIASQSGFSNLKAQCLPEEKAEFVIAQKANSKGVMMIGDGINDAPSLALADVGIAMGNATDISLETADVVFINNRLSSVLDLMKLSKKAHRIIVQNLVFSISVISFLLLGNLFLDVLLTHGVIAHEGSTILVILNSLRLLRN